MHADMHVRTHTHTHTHTHRHTHTHTHTHTQVPTHTSILTVHNLIYTQLKMGSFSWLMTMSMKLMTRTVMHRSLILNKLGRKRVPLAVYTLC